MAGNEEMPAPGLQRGFVERESGKDKQANVCEASRNFFGGDHPLRMDPSELDQP